MPRHLWLFITALAFQPAKALAQATADIADNNLPANAPVEVPGKVVGEDLSIEVASDLKNFDWLELLHDIWTAQLFHVGGTPIRLNQIVVALLVILIGLWLAKRLSGRIARRLGKHEKIDPNLAAAVQKVTFYFIAIVTFFIALPIAGIPMTIFTVLGSAAAIGIGFGAQNLFSNLISGLILMFERPIRLGDIVEVGEHTGKIENIGNRCTCLRRFDGIDVLVPNSSLLEDPVVNWTLRDKDIRGRVTVGVAYGSPVGTVRELIARAVEEHGNILEQPQPEVLFQDFGDNALGFEVFFWVVVNRPIDLRRIESDVRYKIDKLFREADISIAFPQRDLHLDTLRPLEVRMVDSDGSGSPPGSKPEAGHLPADLGDKRSS